MDRPGVWQVPEGSGEQGKMEKTGCKIICGVPTTLVVKGLMMMMMFLLWYHFCFMEPFKLCSHSWNKTRMVLYFFIHMEIMYV